MGERDSSPLLERDRELREAAALLADAREERGRLLLLEAPPGLGKSALAEQTAATARAEGFVVLRAAGRELERSLGWGVARALFEPALMAGEPDEREELLSGPAASARALFTLERDDERSASDASFGILHGLFWLAVRLAEPGPALVVVDDAHWADEASLRFLAYLLGRISEQPIAVLAATRAGEPGAAGLVTRLAGDPATTVCELQPLGAAAVAALVRGRVPGADDGFCRRCWELTAGNPLGVRELVAAISEDGADLGASAARAARSLSRSVLRRLAGLSEDARAFAEAVAVFEGDVPLHRAGALAGLDPSAALAAADELSRVDILTPHDPVGFAHPLLRDAVYGSLPRPRRAEAHRRAAALLLAAHAPAEQVAVHLLSSTPAGDGEVVRTLRSAASSAMAHGVPDSAVAYLERALLEPPAGGERVEVLAELGRAEADIAPRQAIEHLEAAIELTAEPPDRAHLALVLGRAMHDAGRPEDACAAFERGLAEVGDTCGDLSLELEAWYITSAVLLPGRAHQVHDRIEAIAARGGSTPAERALLSKSLVMRMYQGEPHAPLAALARRLWAGGRLLEEGGLGSQAVGHVAGALSYADDYATAGEILRRAREHTRRTGWLTWHAASSQLLARMLIWAGPIDDVVTLADMAVDVFECGRHLYLPASAYCLARGHLERDDPDAAEDVLDRVERVAPPDGIFAAWQHEARGRLAAHRGDFERALSEQLACGRWVDSILVTNPAMFHWRSEAGLAALRLGRRDEAADLIADETARAERFGAPRALGVARRAQALLDRDEDGLRAAAGLFERCGARVELAHTLVELGGAIRRDGRPTDARDVLREALRLAEATGTLAAARRARDELTRAGGRAPAHRNGAGDLTPSERRVAELAAAGRTNRQIADELFVTVKAVEWHLGNAYRKLDIRGRGGLATALAG